MSGWAPSWQQGAANPVKAPSEAPAGTGWEPSWKTGLSLVKNPNINPPTDVKPSDLPQESMGGLLAKYGSETLPVVGGALGSVAGPEGTAVGAGTGSVVRDLIQKYVSGQPTPSFSDSAKTFAKNAALAGIGGQVSGLAAEAFPGPIQSRIASAVSNAVVGAGAKSTEAALTGGEADNSPLALGKDVLTNLGYDIVGGQLVKLGVNQTKAGKDARPTTIKLDEGFGKFRDELTGTPGTPQKSQVETGTEARTAIQDKMKGLNSLEDAQRRAFKKNHIDNNTATFQQVVGQKDTGLVDSQGNKIITPETREIQVKGPINTPNATTLAAEFKPKIEGFVKGPEYQALSDYQKASVSQLMDQIDKLTTGTPVIGTDGKTTVHIPVQEYETVKQMRTLINRVAGGKVYKNLQEGGLTKLAIALDKDIDSSVSQWQNGKQALSDLNEANRTSQFLRTVYGKQVTDRVFGKNSVTGKTDARVEGDPSQMFSVAYKSRENTQRMLESLGPENRSIMQQDYLNNKLLPAGFGPNYSKYDPRAIIDDLENPNSVSRDIYTADQRNGMLRFMRAAEAAGKPTDNKGLNFQGNMVSLGVGGAVRMAAGPGPGIIARVASSELFHNMLTKPEIADYAARLIKIPSTSTEAQILTKKLMRGLRGSTVTVNVDGKDKEGTITESGKIQF